MNEDLFSVFESYTVIPPPDECSPACRKRSSKFLIDILIIARNWSEKVVKLGEGSNLGLFILTLTKRRIYIFVIKRFTLKYKFLYESLQYFSASLILLDWLRTIDILLSFIFLCNLARYGLVKAFVAHGRLLFKGNPLSPPKIMKI